MQLEFSFVATPPSEPKQTPGQNRPAQLGPSRQWTAEAVGYGVLDAVTPRQYRTGRRRWDRLLIQTPGVPQIDPEKETDADIAGIAAGLETLESVCARRGKSWRKVILQRKREIEFERQHLGPLGARLSYERPSTPARRASDEPAAHEE